MIEILTEEQWDAIPQDLKPVKRRHEPRRVIRQDGSVAVEGRDFKILWKDWRRSGLGDWQIAYQKERPQMSGIIYGQGQIL